MLSKFSTFSLVLAFGAIIISAVMLSGPLLNNKNLLQIFTADSAEGHDGLHEAVASKLPMDVRQSFKKYEMGGDANGSETYLKINEDFTDPDNHCEFCARIEYHPGPRGEAAVFYKNDKAVDISGAKRVVFFAKGEKGDEMLQFMAAGSGLEGKKTGKELFSNEQTTIKTKKVKLDPDWQRYEIDLATATSLSKVTHAFGFDAYKGQQLADSGAIIFYVKGIQFDTVHPLNPIPIEQ